MLITGCHPATTLAMLGAEAGIPSLRDLARQEATVLRELLLRLPPEAPGYRACVKCDKLPGTWLAGAATVCTTLGLDKLKREKLWSQKPFKPWACPVPTIIPVVPGCERRGEEELEAVAKCRRLDAFYRAYDALPKAATTVCTDGSAAKGRCPPTTVNGRAGVVWQAEGREDMTASFAAGTYASSFSAEYLALAKGLEGLVDLSRSGALPSGPIHVLTDSQSALVAMQRGPTRQTYVAGVQAWRHLHTLHRAGHSDVVLHFVPAHAGHPGNEAADREAAQPDEDEAKRRDAQRQRVRAIPFNSARAAIRALRRRELLTRNITGHKPIAEYRTHKCDISSRPKQNSKGKQQHEKGTAALQNQEKLKTRVAFCPSQHEEKGRGNTRKLQQRWTQKGSEGEEILMPLILRHYSESKDDSEVCAALKQLYHADQAVCNTPNIPYSSSFVFCSLVVCVAGRQPRAALAMLAQQKCTWRRMASRSSSHTAFLILLSLRPPLPWTASSRAWHRPGWLLVVFIVHSPLGQTGTAHNTRRDASSLVEEGLEFEGGGLRGWLPWGLLVQRDRPEAAAAVLSGNNDNEPACSGRDGSD